MIDATSGDWCHQRNDRMHSFSALVCVLLVLNTYAFSLAHSTCSHASQQLQDKEMVKIEEAIAENSKKQEKILQEALEVGEVLVIVAHVM